MVFIHYTFKQFTVILILLCYKTIQN